MSVKIGSSSKKDSLRLINLCVSYPRPQVGASISQRTPRNSIMHTLKLRNSSGTSIVSNSRRPCGMGDCIL